MKESNTKERLQILMKERNLRQVDIITLVEPYAKEYGIKFNKSDISQYLSGKSEPNQNKLFILSKALGVTPSWLMGFGNETVGKDYTNAPKSKNDNDEKDIARTMEKLKEQLINEQGLMFDGELLDEETIKLVLEEVERQERLIKTINKKYIPKKYRK